MELLRSTLEPLREEQDRVVVGSGRGEQKTIKPVEDAAQDAFVQAYRQLNRLHEPSKFGPWLRRITSNVCLGMLRRRDHSLLPLDRIPEHASDEAPLLVAHNLTVSPTSPLLQTLEFRRGLLLAELVTRIDK